MDQIFSTNRTNDAPNTNESDLIVVGYSSNLYRDDFTALKIESREHLIPWHGDSSLLIDRYDCRGYLNDLREFDNYTAHTQNHKLTKDEHDLEELCDYERYLFLNEEDEEQPTDTSNSHQDGDDDESNGQIGNYASIGYNYLEGGEKKEPVSLIADTRPVDTDVFVPEECLQLPAGIIFPKTLKINTIIMKTAAFVAKQGLQMEILLKAKQSANSQFDFLDYDDELNVYYKHVVQLIRDKKLDVVDYLSKQAPETEKVQNSVVDLKNEMNNHNPDDEDDEDSDDDGYLHPSLLRPSSSECFEQSNNNKAEKTPPPQDTTINDENKENEKAENMPQMSDGNPDPKPSLKDETAKIETPDDSVLRTIIDKLAEYVAKNGKEFEKQIIEKKDERFDFLRENHKYHGYYCSKIKEAKLKIESTKKNVETTNGRMNKKEDEQVHTADCPKSKSPLKKPIDSDHNRKCNKRIKKDSESDANNITNYNSSSSSSKSSSRSSSVASVRKKSSSSETSSDSQSSSSSDESEKAKRKLKKRSSRSSSRHRHRDRKKSHSSKSSHHHHHSHHRHHSKKREKEKSKKSSSRKKYKKKRK